MSMHTLYFSIPSGAGDIGGGNTYLRSLLQELQKNNIYGYVVYNGSLYDVWYTHVHSH